MKRLYKKYQEGGYVNYITDHDSVYDYALGRDGVFYAKKKGDGFFNISLQNNEKAEDKLLNYLKQKSKLKESPSDLEFGLKNNDVAVFKMTPHGDLYLKRIGKKDGWIPIKNKQEVERIQNLMENDIVDPFESINLYRKKNNLPALESPNKPEKLTTPSNLNIPQGHEYFKTKQPYIKTTSSNIKSDDNRNVTLPDLDSIKTQLEEGVNVIKDVVTSPFDLIKNYIDRKTQLKEGLNEDVEEKPIYTYKGKKSPVLNLSEKKDIDTYGLSRQIQSQTIDVLSPDINVTHRNRDNYSDIKDTDGTLVQAFHPFVQYEDFVNKHKKDISKENGYVGIIGYNTKTNKPFFGAYSDIPEEEKKDMLLSRTFINKFYGFKQKNDDIYTIDPNNPKYIVPQFYTDSDKKTSTRLNILTPPQNKNIYSGISGGTIVLINPQTKEKKVVKGSSQQIVDIINKEYDKVKDNGGYLELITVDNGSYSAGLSKKTKEVSSDDLKKYDKLNAGGGGNALFLKSLPTYDEKGLMQFKQDTSYTDNFLKIDSPLYAKYKEKGYSNINTPKTIVLHHTGTSPNSTIDDVLNIFRRTGNSSNVVIDKQGGRKVLSSKNIKDEQGNTLSGEDLTSFHAGKGKYVTSKGDTLVSLNNNSIGVEIIGNTTGKGKESFTQNQIKSTAEYIVPLMLKNKIPITDVTTHDIIALDREDSFKYDIHKNEHKKILKELLTELLEISAYSYLPNFDKSKSSNSEYIDDYLERIMNEQIQRTYPTLNEKQKKVLKETGRLYKQGGKLYKQSLKERSDNGTWAIENSKLLSDKNFLSYIADKKPSQVTLKPLYEEWIKKGKPKSNNKPVVLDAYLKKGGIFIKPENKGKFTAYCKDKGYKGVTKQCVSEGKKSPDPAVRKRAVFAQNFAKQQGGRLYKKSC